MKQLSFADIKLNPSVPEAPRLRLKRQAKVIYNRLVAGAVWTSELRAIAPQYNARINEIRKILADYGLTIDITASRPDGDNRYQIKPLHGSMYQAKLMARQGKNL